MEEFLFGETSEQQTDEEILARIDLAFNFKEFQVISQLNNESYKYSIAARCLGITNDYARDRIIGTKGYTEENYLKLIKSYHGNDFFLKKNPVYFSKSDFCQFNLTVASQGSGKSDLAKARLIGYLSEKESNESLILIDPHQKFSNEVLDLKIVRDMKEKVVYINPSLHQDKKITINPFYSNTELDLEEIQLKAARIASNLKLVFKDETSSGGQETVLTNCIAACIFYKWDLRGLRNLLDIKSKENTYLTKAQKIPDTDLAYFFKNEIQEYKISISAIRRRINEIFKSPSAKRFLLGESSIDLSYFINNGYVIIVSLSEKKLNTDGMKAIGSFIISTIFEIAISRQEIPEEEVSNSVLIIDEAKHFANKSWERFFSECRKVKIWLHLIGQQFSQFDANIFESMMSACRIKFIGGNDAIQYEKASKYLDAKKEELLEELRDFRFMKWKMHNTPQYFHSISNYVYEKSNTAHYVFNKETFIKEQLDKYYIDVEKEEIINLYADPKLKRCSKEKN